MRSCNVTANAAATRLPRNKRATPRASSVLRPHKGMSPGGEKHPDRHSQRDGVGGVFEAKEVLALRTKPAHRGHQEKVTELSFLRNCTFPVPLFPGSVAADRKLHVASGSGQLPSTSV